MDKGIKERKKRRNRILMCCLPLCLCLVIWSVAILPAMLPANDAAPDGNANMGGEMVYEQDDVWIHYVVDNEIKKDKQHLPISPREIFDAWRMKNSIGDEVEFIKVKIDSNNKVTSENGAVKNEIGDYFVYNITISRKIESYYDQSDKELLLESLKRTMTGYSNLNYNEYNLFLE